MKLGITFMVIGSLCVLQYIYFALVPPVTFLEGIGSAVFGIVLLFLGAMRLRRKRQR